MNVSKTENLPPPPGIINSIKMGFDLIATHITAILLPLLLNLFLWLGPRLRISVLLDSIKSEVISNWQASGVSPANIQQMTQSYETSLPNINLFSLIFTFPVGISNLFNFRALLSLIFPGFFGVSLAQSTVQTPLGNPLVLQVSLWNIFGWTILLIAIGWIFGGLYFRNIAWLASVSENGQPVRMSHAIVQTGLLSIFFGIFCMMFGMPILFFLGLLAQISPTIAQFGIFFLSLISMWVIVPLFFWPHGIFLKQQNVITSILSSLQMMRFTLPTSSMFVITVFLLTFGLNFLWSIPPENSWMTIVGLFGHAFVTTALLAGSFVYYRDMNIWLQVVIEKLGSMPVVKRA